jgi:FkbM family methyltransferase
MASPKELTRRLARLLGYEIVNVRADTHPAHLRELFSRVGVNCAIDVGAHRGEYGCFLRKAVGYRGKLMSFEPVTINFAQLERASSRDRDWSAYQLALGTRAERLIIHVPQLTTLASFSQTTASARSIFGDLATVSERETVEVKRLDIVLTEVVAQSPSPRLFVKVDTQGWDREVLEGAGAWWPRIVGVQTEVSVTELYEESWNFAQAMEFMGKLGFVATGIYPAARDDQLRLLELDVVFARFIA